MKKQANMKKQQNRYSTSCLFSRPSFLSGVATVINLAGNFYQFNLAKSGVETDKMSIENDFRMVGQDIWDVIDAVKKDKELLTSSD